MRTLTATKTPAVVRVLSEDVADLATDLQGFHPALSIAVDALVSLLTADDLDADLTQTLIAALAAHGDDFLRLVTLVVRDLGNPATNPAVAGLPVHDRHRARQLTAAFAAQTDLELRRDLASEASAVIDFATE
jgi:hypothetical protein